LGQNYSQVVTLLEPYSVKGMPYIVLYELAYASVTNERLDEEQKKNVLSNITLQTDAEYLKYWIHLGRGEAEDAVDIARAMEDGELITFGLLKRREEVKADKDLTGEEMQILLNEIDQEVEEFEKLMLEAEEAEKEAEEEAQKIEKEKEAKNETAEPEAAPVPVPETAPAETPAPATPETPAATEAPPAAPETPAAEENAAN
ncbi:MAG: type VII secretion protein EssB/YukC, partial [Psychrobacillus sp.]